MVRTSKTISKKLIATFLMVAMLFCMSGVMANDVDSTNSSIAIENLRQKLISENDGSILHNAINEYINNIKNDNTFIDAFSADPNEAIRNVESVINRTIDNMSLPYWYVGGVYGVSGVPNINQEETYYCGIASALQVLTTYGKQGNVSGSTNKQKMDTMKNACQITTAGAIVWQVSDMINRYGGNYVYEKIGNSDDAITSFKSRLITSLYNNSPVILHSTKKYISYYPSNDDGGTIL